MKIAFNASVCGLANNGGSKTIFRSADVLRALGHEVNIVARVDHFTWFDHPACSIAIPSNVDVVVAVSASDVNHTLSHSPKGAERVWWMRGWEKWIKGGDEFYFVSQAKKIKVIVNSSWLKTELAQYDIHSQLCYSGLDIDFWQESKPKYHIVGGVINERHETKRNDIVKKYASVIIDKPHNDYELRDKYSMCSVWLAPTELEGFHNVSAEAALCGSLIVCNRINSNGMGDWATDRTAERFSYEDEIKRILGSPDYDKANKARSVLIDKIGNRERNMKEFVRLISA